MHTKRYYWHRRWGRFQVTISTYVHHYSNSKPRIVVQPSLVVDL